MKTAKTVLQQYKSRKLAGCEYNEEVIMKAMVEYTALVIDDILSKPSMIYVEDGEAVYDYEKFGEMVKAL